MMSDTWLDHVAVATDNLDRAEAAYRRLGFNLTRRSSHSGADGPWGTGNHCAMLREGYFELIGITDPALHHEHLKTALARYTGLHLVALGTCDSDRTHDDVQARGVMIKVPYDIARQVPFGDVTRQGRFRITEIEQAWFPEADLFFCQHETPVVLWQPDLLEHPNGVTSLAGVTIVSAEAQETARRIALVTGVDGKAFGDGYQFNLSRGTIDVVSETSIAERFPGVVSPILPWVGAVTFTVSDIGLVQDLARRSGFTVDRHGDGSVWAEPEYAEGSIVVFRP